VNVAEFVGASLLVLFGTGWTWQTSGSLEVSIAVCWLFVALSSVLVGRVYLRCSQVPPRWQRSFPLEFVVGGSFLAVGSSFMKLMLPFGLEWVSVIFLAGVLLLAKSRFVRRGRLNNVRSILRTPRMWIGMGNRTFVSSRIPERQAGEIFATVITLSAATLWLQSELPLIEKEEVGTSYRPFVEMFYHSMRTSALTYPGSTTAIGSFQLAGEPLPFYQYGSYWYPAFFSRVTGLPVWQAVTSVWYPLGLCWIGLAAYSLGSLYAGPRGGIVAVVAAAVIPDLYFLFPQHAVAMLSFHRFLSLSPGLCFGCGAAAAFLILLTHSFRRPRFLTYAGSVVLLLQVGFLKFNVFLSLLLLGLLILTLGLLWRPTPRKFLEIVPFIGIGAALLFVGRLIPNAPTLSISFDLGVGFLQNILQSGGEAFGSTLPVLSQPSWGGLFARLVFFATLLLGWMLPLYPFLLVPILEKDGPVDKRMLMLPISSLFICFLLFVGLAPNENGDPYELAHRHFVWCYLSVASSMSAILAGAIFRRFWIGWPLLAVGSLGFLWTIPLALSRSDIPTGRLPLPSGLLSACSFVHRASDPDDVVATSNSDPSWIAAGVTQRRMYVCTSSEETFPGHVALKETILGRQQHVAEALSFRSLDDLERWSRETNVRWFIVLPSTRLAWSPVIANYPTFTDEGCRVYDLSLLKLASKEP
jgi:hypothetical protein